MTELPYHERIDDPVFREAVNRIDSGDEDGLRAWLTAHPDVVHTRVRFPGAGYFEHPGLLEFIAENPVRHGIQPTNIVAITRLLIAAGADARSRNEALKLVASGRVPRECNSQAPLIALLCSAGAPPDGAMHAALAHQEMAAVQALLEHGARVTLVLAAALGRRAEVRALLSAATADDRHRATAIAAQLGQSQTLRLLLDAGEDANRYNPAGFHAHATPLHQAALRGHIDCVRLLVEHGAKLDARDRIWQRTPADWAAHASQTETERWLRAAEKGAGR